MLCLFPPVSRFNSQAAALKPPAAPKEPKAVKIPKQPKTKRLAGPLSSYALFVKEVYPGLKAADPKANIGSCSPMWKTMSAADKDKCALALASPAQPHALCRLAAQPLCYCG